MSGLPLIIYLFVNVYGSQSMCLAASCHPPSFSSARPHGFQFCSGVVQGLCRYMECTYLFYSHHRVDPILNPLLCAIHLTVYWKLFIFSRMAKVSASMGQY